MFGSFSTPWTVAHQPPLSMRFSMQEHWSGLPFPSPKMKLKSESEVAPSCPTLSDPMDCSLPDSSVHGIFQARDTGVGCHCLLQKVKLEEYKWRRRKALTDHGCLLKSEHFVLETGRKKPCWESLLLGLLYSTFECFSFFDYPMRKILTPCFVGWGVSCLTLLKDCL